MYLKIAEWLIWLHFRRVAEKLRGSPLGEEEFNWKRARGLLRKEVQSIPSFVVGFIDYSMSEEEIIFQRLNRLYDPGQAFSEAKNRADALKLGERPVTLPDGDVIIPKLTAKQEMALRFRTTGKMPYQS